MSHNPQAASGQEFRLPGHDVLAITGRDAVAFAQAQFMNDVAALGDGDTLELRVGPVVVGAEGLRGREDPHGSSSVPP